MGPPNPAGDTSVPQASELIKGNPITRSLFIDLNFWNRFSVRVISFGIWPFRRLIHRYEAFSMKSLHHPAPPPHCLYITCQEIIHHVYSHIFIITIDSIWMRINGFQFCHYFVELGWTINDLSSPLLPLQGTKTVVTRCEHKKTSIKFKNW